jgi:16S rRNA (uracil1498-N3)-methyltransferase
VLQKGTELGVDGFVPVMAARSVAKVPRGAVDGKMERWKRIVLEASKQCGTPRVPDISDPTTLASLLRDGPTAGKSTRRLFLEEGARTRLRDLALIRSRESDTADADPDEIQILAGPEGGWTNVETRDILEHGFEAVSLGELILRAETAAICSLAIVTQFWE